jgi:hypothetical protein
MTHDKYYTLSMIYYVCIHNGKVWHLADVSLMVSRHPCTIFGPL